MEVVCVNISEYWKSVYCLSLWDAKRRNRACTCISWIELVIFTTLAQRHSYKTHADVNNSTIVRFVIHLYSGNDWIDQKDGKTMEYKILKFRKWSSSSSPDISRVLIRKNRPKYLNQCNIWEHIQSFDVEMCHKTHHTQFHISPKTSNQARKCVLLELNRSTKKKYTAFVPFVCVQPFVSYACTSNTCRCVSKWEYSEKRHPIYHYANSLTHKKRQ